jgi:hypothetical protein
MSGETRGAKEEEPVVRLERWRGPWAPEDADANFKADVALYSLLEPLTTITNLSAALDIPVGALCRYVLAKWASGGSGGVLELGPSMVDRLWSVCAAAEQDGTDAARLAAYDQLRQMLQWLRLPLVGDAGYDQVDPA